MTPCGSAGAWLVDEREYSVTLKSVHFGGSGTSIYIYFFMISSSLVPCSLCVKGI